MENNITLDFFKILSCPPKNELAPRMSWSGAATSLLVLVAVVIN